MDVVGIGNPCVDFLAGVSEIPAAGDSATLHTVSIQGGGKVATALVTLGRLGKSSAVIGTIGDDEFGAFCIHDFAQHYVDTSHLHVERQANTAFAIVLSDQRRNERSILYQRSTSEAGSSGMDLDFIRKAKILHLESARPQDIQAAIAIRKAGGLVSLDADHYMPEMDRLTPFVDFFIGSAEYYHARFPDGALADNMQSVADQGPRVVVFTFGAEGCTLMDQNGFSHIPAYHVPVSDTTGAGDVFHGAFLYGVLQGWGNRESAAFASATAAIKCMYPGGRAGIGTAAMVGDFMRDGCFEGGALDARVRYYQNVRIVR